MATPFDDGCLRQWSWVVETMLCLVLVGTTKRIVKKKNPWGLILKKRYPSTKEKRGGTRRGGRCRLNVTTAQLRQWFDNIRVARC